jgi:hypothetical protein
MWNAAHLGRASVEIKRRKRNAPRTSCRINKLWIKIAQRSLWARHDRNHNMLQLIAIFAFAAVLVAAMVVLQETIRASRREIVDALLGGPMAHHRAPRCAPVTGSLPRRSPRSRAAA